jgi:hypothetical protein
VTLLLTYDETDFVSGNHPERFNMTRRKNTSREARRRKTPTRSKDVHKMVVENQNIPRTAAQYDARSANFKDVWKRVVKVISKMRSGASLRRALENQHISPRTVKKWAGPVLQKRSTGKWGVTKTDRLLRELRIITPDGEREILVRGSRQATQLSRYFEAVHRYLETGDTSKLVRFQGKFIKDARGVQIPFLTDQKKLKLLGYAGALSFESLYTRI